MKSFEIESNLKICRDPDDDKFINCAIDAKAIYIVSGDNDLLTIKNFAGIEIVTAREFYDKYLNQNSD
ncbi:MAG: putative toxin-antitoxin system toxin component, PIN family [Selenomonadaceae bacterium]|nr:putative toxin-antitoxin system toxin component, PIN family [Selenomonadaceae bacterium]